MLRYVRQTPQYTLRIGVWLWLQFADSSITAFLNPARIKLKIGKTSSVKYLQFAKRVVVAIIGGTVVLIGIALIVLPGPAFIVIPLGLSILASEFLWAKRWLQKIRKMAAQLTAKKSDKEKSKQHGSQSPQ